MLISFNNSYCLLNLEFRLRKTMLKILLLSTLKIFRNHDKVPAEDNIPYSHTKSTLVTVI